MNKYKQYLERNGGSVFGSAFRRYGAACYSNDLFRSLCSPIKTSGREPDKWLFIVGCYNSGTTILKDVVGAHNSVSTLPREGAKFSDMLPRPEDLGWQRMWISCREHMNMPVEEKISTKMVQRIKEDWSPWWKKGSACYLEKSVSNTTRIEWIDRYFDNAHFLAISRDPIAVVEGIRRKASPQGEARNILGAESYTIDMAIEQWLDANERILDVEKSIKKIMRLKYEDFVMDPESHLSRIWKFLELEDQRVSFENGDLSINNQTITLENMNSKSLARIGTGERKTIETKTSALAGRLGY